MNNRVPRAGAVVALALLNVAAVSAQAPKIVVESLDWTPSSGVALVARADYAPSDWRLGIYTFSPDAGWSPLGNCNGITRQTAGPYAGKFWYPLFVTPRASKLAFFLVLPTESIPCTFYADSLPALTNSRPVLTITRSSPYTQTLQFSGYTWTVKTTDGYTTGPGPNVFCGTSPFVDAQGKLHLRIEANDCSSEVILRKPPGYGKYKFTVETPLSSLHPNAVLGMFTWSDDASNNHREIDIELSRWQNTVSTNAQFVVQPYTTPGNMLRFSAPTSTPNNTFSFDWAPSSVQFSAPGLNWELTGNGIPTTGDESIRFNLYWYLGASAKTPQEIVISNFEFVPSTRMGVTTSTDFSLFDVPAKGGRIPTMNVGLPSPWTFDNLPPQVRAARVGSTNTVDLTVMPNWSSAYRSWSGTFSGGPRLWQVVQQGAAGTVEQRTVGMLYYNLFGRVPEDEERDWQVVKALNQGVPVGELATRMFTSQEFQLTGHFVAGLYAGLLCRDPEYPGWLWQRDALQNGLQTARGMVASFVGSQEFQLRHGSGDTALVNGLYRCALGRSPSPTELQFQLSALAGGLPRTDFALSILNSPEFQLMTDKQVTAFLLYATLLNRDATAAEKAGWVNVLATTPLRNVIDGFVNSPEFSLALQ